MYGRKFATWLEPRSGPEFLGPDLGSNQFDTRPNSVLKFLPNFHLFDDYFLSARGRALLLVWGSL